MHENPTLFLLYSPVQLHIIQNTEKSLECAGLSRLPTASDYSPIRSGSQQDASGTHSIATNTREEDPPLASFRECTVKTIVAHSGRSKLLTADVGLKRQVRVDVSLA